MLLHYCIWLNKKKYSSDASWILFSRRVKLMFTSLQMDSKFYFGERKRWGNLVVNRSEKVLRNGWFWGHLKQLWSRATCEAKLRSRRELHFMLHCDTSVSGSNRVSAHLRATGTGAPPLHHHVNAAFGLHSVMKCKVCSLELLSWWIQPPLRHSSEMLWVCLVTAANPSVMNVAHKNVSCKRGIYCRRFVHTWCLSYISSWPDALMPGLVLWSHIRILLWGDKGKECLEKELQEDEKGFWQHVELDVVLVLMPLVPMPSRHFLWMTRNLGK